MYYICFKLVNIPDLSLMKYSVLGGASVDDVLEKQQMFLRQIHRYGIDMGVSFHLLYFYNADKSVPSGTHLQIYLYAAAEEKKSLLRVRQFIERSAIGDYYRFARYEVSETFSADESTVWLDDKEYTILSSIDEQKVEEGFKKAIDDGYMYCLIDEQNQVLDIQSSSERVDSFGRLNLGKKFKFCARMRKKEYFTQHFEGKDIMELYSVLEWAPNEKGRLMNLMKTMEGYNETAAVRIDLFPVDLTSHIREQLPYQDLKSISVSAGYGRNQAADEILKSWDQYIKKLNENLQFNVNVVAFGESKEVAVMLADSIGAESNESGTYSIDSRRAGKRESFDVFYRDEKVWQTAELEMEYLEGMTDLFTLDEAAPMFRLPALYIGEHVECKKETDPEFTKDGADSLMLGISEQGYEVYFPLTLLKKHAFVAGVPGSGKTNTMLFIVTSLWKDYRIPFLVLEPAKQEYRALANIEGMEELTIFSPGADTRFPLHINPFEFPVGLTLAEHIANLKAVFEGAFELPPPSPHFIDTCIEQVYVNAGWNINGRNDGSLPYPTMQELYDSLEIAVKESHYQGETLGNLQSVLEVRVGSLLKREIGNVYNVPKSTFNPSEWIERPVIIELEALGEGPANFMTLLISTLIREELKLRKFKPKSNKSIQHVIFYEEAHNLIGPDTDGNKGDKVDPKVSATKFLVKMLAEVRALNEGIVIADQLPTVMAAEVLKNTGLKIGHRITAVDDRSVLGQTMSASSEQMEEQGLYLPGNALVYFEGLKKPFKMQLGKWQENQAMYDSLPDDELASKLEDNQVYLDQLQRSSELLVGKMQGELNSLKRDLAKAMDTYLRAYRERRRKESNLQWQKCRTDIKNKRAAIDLENSLRRNREIEEEYQKKVTRLLRKLNVIFMNYTAIVNNYLVFQADFLLHIIYNVLQIIDDYNKVYVEYYELWDVIAGENWKMIQNIDCILEDYKKFYYQELEKYAEGHFDNLNKDFIARLLQCMDMKNRCLVRQEFSSATTLFVTTYYAYKNGVIGECEYEKGVIPAIKGFSDALGRMQSKYAIPSEMHTGGRTAFLYALAQYIRQLNKFMAFYEYYKARNLRKEVTTQQLIEVQKSIGPNVQVVDYLLTRPTIPEDYKRAWRNEIKNAKEVLGV